MGEPQPVSVGEGIEQFLEAKSHLRKSTRDDYEVMLRAWERDHTPAGLRLRDLRPKHLKGYIHASKIAQATRCKRYRTCRAFLNWTVDAGF